LLWGEQAETVNTTVAEAAEVDLLEFLTLTETIWYLQVAVAEQQVTKVVLKLETAETVDPRRVPTDRAELVELLERMEPVLPVEPEERERYKDFPGLPMAVETVEQRKEMKEQEEEAAVTE
jgi:hypothetical protein